MIEINGKLVKPKIIRFLKRFPFVLVFDNSKCKLFEITSIEGSRCDVTRVERMKFGNFE